MSKRLAILDSTGSVVRIFSREGRGPGEIQSAFEIAPIPDGLFMVADLGNLRLSIWRDDGTLAGTIASPPFWTHVTSSPEGPLLLVPRRDTVGPAGAGWAELHRVDGPRGLTRLTTALPAAIPMGPGTALPQRVCVYCDVVVTAGRIVGVLDGGRYEIGVFDTTGRFLARVGIPNYPIVKYTDEEAAILNAGAKRRMGNLATDWRGKSKNTLMNRSLGIDWRGRLWVRPTVVAGAQSRVDVFNLNGEVITSLHLPPGLKWLRVTNDRAIGLFEDDEGLQRLEVYRIEEG